MHLAKYSNHYNELYYQQTDFYQKKDYEIKEFFYKQGFDFKKVVEYCREYKNNVPIFENVIGSVWHSNNVKVAQVDIKSGTEKQILNGSGIYTDALYWTQFEEAVENIVNALNDQQYFKIHTAIVLGITCIESYINYRASIWNDQNPSDQLVDNKNHIVNIDDKINNWLPKMLKGSKLNKSGKNWNYYINLRSIRDNSVIHAKNATIGMTLPNIVEIINQYRYGIAGILVDLHMLFKEKIPSRIIRSCFQPAAYIPDSSINVSDTEYDITIAQKDNPVLLVDKAELLIENGNYHEAIKILDAAIESFDDYAKAYFLRGFVYKKIKKDSDAIINFQRSLSIDKDQVATYINLGEMFFSKDNLEKTLDYFLSAFKLDNKNEGLIYKISYIYKNIGNIENAIKYINLCISINHSKSYYYLFRGACYDEESNYDLALEDYNTALSINADNHLVLHNRSNTYLKINEFSKALMDITRAIEINSEESNYYYLRAKVITYSGLTKENIENAIKDLYHALKIKPDFFDAKVALNKLLEIKEKN